MTIQARAVSTSLRLNWIWAHAEAFGPLVGRKRLPKETLRDPLIRIRKVHQEDVLIGARVWDPY